MTQDGYEAMFAVNYLSVFLLTTQLLPVLNSSGKQDNSSRIVNVSSEGYKMAKRIDFENINAEKGFKTFPVYGHSKLALMLFNLELAEQLANHPVNTYAVHPRRCEHQPWLWRQYYPQSLFISDATSIFQNTGTRRSNDFTRSL